MEEAINYQKKYQNVAFKFQGTLNRTYSAFCEHLLWWFNIMIVFFND